MNISNYYWYFKSALSPRFCNEVIAYANQQKEVMALTGGYGDQKLNAKLKFIAPKGNEEQGVVQFKIEGDVYLKDSIS